MISGFSANIIGEFIGKYGIVAVFIGTFLEGESVLMISGAMASQSFLDPLYVWVAASLGAWTGHIVWFVIGKLFGKTSIDKIADRYNFSAKVQYIYDLISANKIKTVVLLQYLYGVRMVGAVTFGISNIKFKWFSIAELINCAIWAFIIGSIGFVLGKTVSVFAHSPVYAVWIAVSVVILTFIGMKTMRRLKGNDRRKR